MKNLKLKKTVISANIKIIKKRGKDGGSKGKRDLREV